MDEKRDVVVRMSCVVSLGADPVKNADAVNAVLANGFKILGLDAQRVDLICDSVAPALAGRPVDGDLPAAERRPANLIKVGAQDSDDEKREKTRAYMREYQRKRRAAAEKPVETPAAPRAEQNGKNTSPLPWPAAKNGHVIKATTIKVPRPVGTCEICDTVPKTVPKILRKCESCSKMVCAKCGPEKYNVNHTPYIDCKECAGRP